MIRYLKNRSCEESKYISKQNMFIYSRKEQTEEEHSKCPIRKIFIKKNIKQVVSKYSGGRTRSILMYSKIDFDYEILHHKKDT